MMDTAYLLSIEREAACAEALERMRRLRVTSDDVSLWREHMAEHPNVAGCAMMYLGAQILYHEQLKAALDSRVDCEIAEMVERYKGTEEAELMRHVQDILFARGSRQSLSASRDYLTDVAKRIPKEKGEHLQFLGMLAVHRLEQLEALEKRKMPLLASEQVNKIAETFGRPGELSSAARQSMMRFGMLPA